VAAAAFWRARAGAMGVWGFPARAAVEDGIGENLQMGTVLYDSDLGRTRIRDKHWVDELWDEKDLLPVLNFTVSKHKLNLNMFLFSGVI
jgi:hypothetical protein